MMKPEDMRDPAGELFVSGAVSPPEPNTWWSAAPAESLLLK